MVETAYKFEPDPKESESEEQIESFLRNLAEHSVDKEPTVPKTEKQKKLTGNSYAAEDVLIERCSPAIEIEKIVLEPGKSIVLIGPNGSGKSTVFDAVMEIRNAHMNTREGKGAILYGKPVHNREKLRISRLNQEEILGHIKDLQAQTALDIAESEAKQDFPVKWEDPDLVEQNIENDEARHRIEKLRSQIIKLFDMEEFMQRKVKDLSGGERTKLTLFMELLSEPDVLLLDEPTNHLDLESIAKLTGLFKVYQNAGVSILSVSHVNWFLEDAGRQGVIEIQMDKDTRKAVSSKSSYKKYIKNKARPEMTIVEGDIQWKAEQVKQGNIISPVTDKISIPNSPLQDFEIDALNGGDVWVLSGNNGTGKTKLMEAMADRKKGLKSFNRSKGVNVAYMPQFWPREIAEGTLEDFFYWIKDQINPHSDIVAKNLTNAARKIGFGSRGLTKKIDRSFLQMPLNSLSGGEQRLMWFLATSAFREVDVMMLDEPTNHMDKNLQEKITKAIQAFPGAVVLSTHDMQLIEEISTDVGKKAAATFEPRNYVLEKENGVTSIRQSKQSPAEYMKDRLKNARAEAKRFKVE